LEESEISGKYPTRDTIVWDDSFNIWLCF